MTVKPFAQVTVICLGRRARFGSFDNAFQYLMWWRLPLVHGVRDFCDTLDRVLLNGH